MHLTSVTQQYNLFFGNSLITNGKNQFERVIDFQLFRKNVNLLIISILVLLICDPTSSSVCNSIFLLLQVFIPLDH